MPRTRIDGLLSLLDIYSPRPAARIAVLLTMAVGAFLLARGAAAGSAIGALPFLLLVWANRERFLATVEDLLARHPWLVPGVPLLVCAAKLAMDPPAASDDLLRHIASAFWPRGYADMYVHSALPPVPLYPSFDALVGGLARLVGPLPAMWTMQALACAGFLYVFLSAARRLTAGNPAAGLLVLAALVLVLQVMASRLFLARPEIFMTVWALGALQVRGLPGALAWSTAGLALGSGYWLAAIYFPAAILLPLGLRGRLLTFAALCLGWVALWWWMTDGRLVETVSWTIDQVGNRVEGFAVSENVSILNLLVAPPMLALLFAAAWAARRASADNRLLWLAAFYLLSNQARYGGIVAPLLALHFLSACRDVSLPLPKPARLAAVALGAMLLSVKAAELPKVAEMPHFEMPAGSVVLTGFSAATYSTLFWNPGGIRIAPAFEIGALDGELQRAVLRMNRGELDCEALAGYGFTHLIENSLAGPVPACLELLSMQRGWRLWAFRAPS